jgi:two-component system CheB/CheR fusion protein
MSHSSNLRFRATTPRRVVIVDDNADAGDLLGIALRLAGHHVKVLEDPHEAADLVATFKADVVVLDLGMPGIDGYGVAAELRRRLGDCTPPLIALTGYGNPEEIRRTKAAGFAAHCVKPAGVDEIIATIDALFEV